MIADWDSLGAERSPLRSVGYLIKHPLRIDVLIPLRESAFRIIVELVERRQSEALVCHGINRIAGDLVIVDDHELSVGTMPPLYRAVPGRFPLL